MKLQSPSRGCWILFGALFLARVVLAQNAPAATGADQSVLLTIEGTVEISSASSGVWTPAQTNQVLHTGDRLRTGPHSRATVRLSDLTVLRVNELTTLLIQQPPAAGKLPVLNVEKGGAYFYSRERPAEMEFRTPLVAGAIRGTEFNLAVADDGKTVVTLLDGEVALSNAGGGVNLVSGEQGIVEPGQPPGKTATVNAINVIQWVLYYPAVLDLDELNFSDAEKSALAASLAAYRTGDLPAALADWPADRAPASDSGRIYYAELLLSAGQVDQAEAQLQSIPSPMADASSYPVCCPSGSWSRRSNMKIGSAKNNPGWPVNGWRIPIGCNRSRNSTPRWPPRAPPRKNPRTSVLRGSGLRSWNSTSAARRPRSRRWTTACGFRRATPRRSP